MANNDYIHESVSLEGLAQDIESAPERGAQRALHMTDESHAPEAHTNLWKDVAQRRNDSSNRTTAGKIAGNIRKIAQKKGGTLSAKELCDSLTEVAGGMSRQDAFFVGQAVAEQLVHQGEPNFTGTDTTVMVERASVSEAVIAALAAGTDLEPSHVALKQAREIANAMVPRTKGQTEQRQDLTNRIFELMMRAKKPDNDFDASMIDQEADALKREAVQLAKEMPRPGTVLLFSDCVSLGKVDIITDGELRIPLNEFDSFTIPSGTPVTVSSVGMAMIVLAFTDGAVLRLREENFPPDGIPVKEFPGKEGVAE